MTGECLVITVDGRLCVTDYTSLYRAILTVLCKKPAKLIDLITDVKESYIEFRYLPDKQYISVITALMKDKMISCRYKL